MWFPYVIKVGGVTIDTHITAVKEAYEFGKKKIEVLFDNDIKARYPNW